MAYLVVGFLPKNANRGINELAQRGLRVVAVTTGDVNNNGEKGEGLVVVMEGPLGGPNLTSDDLANYEWTS